MPTSGVEPPDNTVATDLPCMACGYNLRGLRRDGACPECGGSIPLSIEAHRGAFGDRRWIGRVARGCDLLLLMPPFGPAIVMFVLGLVSAASYSLPRLSVPLWSAALVLLVGVPGVGLIMLTSPEPGEVDGPARHMRQGIRLAMLAFPVMASLLATAIWDRHHATIIFAIVAIGVTVAGGFVLLTLYCRSIAQRMGDGGVSASLLLTLLIVVVGTVMAIGFAFLQPYAAVLWLLGALFGVLLNYVSLATFRSALRRSLDVSSSHRGRE